MQLMSWSLLSKKEYEEAKPVCATALGMTERLYGSHAVPTAAMMVNMATAYMNTCDLKLGPENLLKRAIIIFEDFQNWISSYNIISGVIKFRKFIRKMMFHKKHIKLNLLCK